MSQLGVGQTAGAGLDSGGGAGTGDEIVTDLKGSNDMI